MAEAATRPEQQNKHMEGEQLGSLETNRPTHAQPSSISLGKKKVVLVEGSLVSSSICPLISSQSQHILNNEKEEADSRLCSGEFAANQNQYVWCVNQIESMFDSFVDAVSSCSVFVGVHLPSNSHHEIVAGLDYHSRSSLQLHSINRIEISKHQLIIQSHLST